MREGTGNFQNGDLLYMATHPVADAIRTVSYTHLTLPTKRIV